MSNVESILKNVQGTESMPSEAQTQTYKTIMKLYDDADRLIQAAQHYGQSFEPYVNHLQKFIDQVEKQTGSIVDHFLKSVEGGREMTNSQKLKIENSVKDINMAAKQFLLKISN